MHFQGLFGAGMISSYLKLVHILSVNPYMGPLQISLGRMLGDILKFIILFCLGELMLCPTVLLAVWRT